MAHVFRNPVYFPPKKSRNTSKLISPPRLGFSELEFPLELFRQPAAGVGPAEVLLLHDPPAEDGHLELVLAPAADQPFHALPVAVAVALAQAATVGEGAARVHAQALACQKEKKNRIVAVFKTDGCCARSHCSAWRWTG